MSYSYIGSKGVKSQMFEGPFTLTIFAAILVVIFAAILWQFQIARVNYWRDSMAIWITCSLHRRFEIAAKSRSKSQQKSQLKSPV